MNSKLEDDQDELLDYMETLLEEVDNVSKNFEDSILHQPLFKHQENDPNSVAPEINDKDEADNTEGVKTVDTPKERIVLQVQGVQRGKDVTNVLTKEKPTSVSGSCKPFVAHNQQNESKAEVHSSTIEAYSPNSIFNKELKTISTTGFDSMYRNSVSSPAISSFSSGLKTLSTTGFDSVHKTFLPSPAVVNTNKTTKDVTDCSIGQSDTSRTLVVSDNESVDCSVKRSWKTEKNEICKSPRSKMHHSSLSKQEASSLMTDSEHESMKETSKGVKTMSSTGFESQSVYKTADSVLVSKATSVDHEHSDISGNVNIEDDSDESNIKRDWMNERKIKHGTRNTKPCYVNEIKEKTSDEITHLCGNKDRKEKRVLTVAETSEDSTDTIQDLDNYSSFIVTEDDSEMTVVVNQKEDKAAVRDTEPEIKLGNKIVANCLLKKRKRNSSLTDKEITPKQKKTLFNPQYSSNKRVLSPIKDVKEKNNNIFNPTDSEKTPIILSKFGCFDPISDTVQSCSTPVNIIQSEKDKLKAKKSIFRFDRIKTDNEASDSDGSVISKGSNFDDVDELISEITAICEEGLNRDNDYSVVEDDFDKENQISKIDVKELISEIESEFESTLKAEKENSESILREESESKHLVLQTDTESEMPENKDIANTSRDKEQLNTTSSPDLSESQKKSGRFKNVTAVVSTVDIVVDEDYVEDENDVLGLDDLDDDDGYIDEEALATLSKTVLAESTESKMDKTMTDKDSKKVDVKDAENKENNNSVKLFIDVVDAKSTAKEIVAVNISEPKKKEAKPTPSYSKKSFQPDLSDLKLMKYFDTAACRLEDNSTEMKAARQRWKSHGVPNPDINLTVATTFRKHFMSLGKMSPIGELEGEKICCTDLQFGLQEYNGVQFSSLEMTVERLHHQRTVLENMHYEAVYRLRTQMTEDIDLMKERHGREINHLRHR